MPRSVMLWAFLLACLALAATTGCGSTSSRAGGEELTAERALTAALEGRSPEFVSLVAPSFLQEARLEMPDIGDESLGGVLIAGFADGLPFTAIRDAEYRAEISGDKAVVHVWGIFLDTSGGEINLAEAEAVRIPLIKEGGSWYLDLLDL